MYPHTQAHASSDRRWEVPSLIEELKRKAQQQGLWNLFIPADMAALFRGVFPDTLPRSDQQLLSGPGLSNLVRPCCADVVLMLDRALLMGCGRLLCCHDRETVAQA